MSAAWYLDAPGNDVEEQKDVCEACHAGRHEACSLLPDCGCEAAYCQRPPPESYPPESYPPESYPNGASFCTKMDEVTAAILRSIDICVCDMWVGTELTWTSSNDWIACDARSDSCSCTGPNCSCIAGKYDPAHTERKFVLRRNPALWTYDSTMHWCFTSPYPGSARVPTLCHPCHACGTPLSSPGPEGCDHGGDVDFAF